MQAYTSAAACKGASNLSTNLIYSSTHTHKPRSSTQAASADPLGTKHFKRLWVGASPLRWCSEHLQPSARSSLTRMRDRQGSRPSAGSVPCRCTTLGNRTFRLWSVAPLRPRLPKITLEACQFKASWSVVLLLSQRPSLDAARPHQIPLAAVMMKFLWAPLSALLRAMSRKRRQAAWVMPSLREDPAFGPASSELRPFRPGVDSIEEDSDLTPDTRPTCFRLRTLPKFNRALPLVHWHMGRSA